MEMNMRFLIFLVLAAAVAGGHTKEAKADEVTGLPGWAGSLSSKWFSGMLPIGADMFSHYIYVQREVWVWVHYIVCVLCVRRGVLYPGFLYLCTGLLRYRDLGIKLNCS